MLAAARSGLCAPFSAPPPPKNKLGQVQTPRPATLLAEIAVDGWRSMVRPIANFGTAFEPGWRLRSTLVPG
jgi:hypothetical protein